MSGFDFESLTLDEVETIENLIGESVDEAFKDGKPKGKALKSFIWIINKRSNPNFTMEDASKVSLGDAIATLQGDSQKKA